MEKCLNCGTEPISSLEFCLNCGKYFSKDTFAPPLKVLYEKGVEYYHLKDFCTAIKSFSEAIELDAANAEAYWYRGEAFWKEGRYDEAITDLTRVIELVPDNSSYYHDRALVYKEKGLYNEAAADYTKAIELAIAYRESGQYEKDMAEKDMAEDDLLVQAVRAAILETKGTKALYTQLLLGQPSPPYYLNERAYFYKEHGQLDKAIADLDYALEMAPEFSNGFDSRAEMYEAAGEYQKAIDDCKRALELDPDLASSRKMLARCEEKLKK